MLPMKILRFHFKFILLINYRNRYLILKYCHKQGKAIIFFLLLCRVREMWHLCNVTSIQIAEKGKDKKGLLMISVIPPERQIVGPHGWIWSGQDGWPDRQIQRQIDRQTSVIQLDTLFSHPKETCQKIFIKLHLGSRERRLNEKLFFSSHTLIVKTY